MDTQVERLTVDQFVINDLLSRKKYEEAADKLAENLKDLGCFLRKPSQDPAEWLEARARSISVMSALADLTAFRLRDMLKAWRLSEEAVLLSEVEKDLYPMVYAEALYARARVRWQMGLLDDAMPDINRALWLLKISEPSPNARYLHNDQRSFDLAILLDRAAILGLLAWRQGNVFRRTGYLTESRRCSSQAFKVSRRLKAPARVQARAAILWLFVRHPNVPLWPVEWAFWGRELPDEEYERLMKR